MGEVKTLAMQLAKNPGSGPDLAEELAAALGWWREAGVDGDWLDAPRAWLAPPVDAAPAAQASVAAPVPVEIPPPCLEIPGDLASFTAWWLSEPLLDNGQAAGRVPPRGSVKAELMVLIPEPEREDRETLLASAQGRLLESMLAAMQIAPANVYFASILPRHTPHADWALARAAGLGEVLARHVALVAPKRLIAFTGNILPLLGHDPANSPALSRQFNHGEGSVPLLAARELAALLERPRWKAGFWQAWLEWTAENSLAAGTMETEQS
jgi:hypothetical protein